MMLLKEGTYRDILFLILVILSIRIQAQDLEYTHQVIDTLCSETMFGRGYVKDGHTKAAEYISNELKNIGVQPWNSTYYQKFNMDVNVITKHPMVKFDSDSLQVGKDFIVNSLSSSLSGTFKVVVVDSVLFSNRKKLRKVLMKGFDGKAVLVDLRGLNKNDKEAANSIRYQPFHASLVVTVSEEKLTWGMAQEQKDHAAITVRVDSTFQYPESVSVNLKTELKKNLESQNVIGFIPGDIYPDSIVVVSAHYDHLGGIGDKVYIPGANDNASGISFLLNLAKKYVQADTLKYSIVLVAFGGEEVGLIGSKFMAESDLLDLPKVKILINTDILGTGDEGIKVVNATNNLWVYNQLVKINDENQLLKTVGKRGPAANSDHHPFYEKNVPAIFIYTLGGISAYHDIYDRPDTLPLTKYSEVFQLIDKFIVGL